MNLAQRQQQAMASAVANALHCKRGANGYRPYFGSVLCSRTGKETMETLLWWCEEALYPLPYASVKELQIEGNSVLITVQTPQGDVVVEMGGAT